MTQPHDQPPESVPAIGEHPQPDESVPAPRLDPAAGHQGPAVGHQGPDGYPAMPVYPQYGWYPQAPGFGGAGRPIHRPGAAIAAAVFAFLQAGITVIATAIMVIVVTTVSDTGAGGLGTHTSGVGTYVMIVGWAVAVIQLTGSLLLIVGGIRLVLGRGRAALISGIVLELIISLGYLVMAVVANSAQGSSEFESVLRNVSQFFVGMVADGGADAQAAMLPAIMVIAVLLAIMPVVSLILSAVAPVGYYLRETYFLRHGFRETRTG